MAVRKLSGRKQKVEMIWTPGEDGGPRQILEARIEGKRGRGRPRNVWKDDKSSSWKEEKDDAGS